jgi:hypothetical protein
MGSNYRRDDIQAGLRTKAEELAARKEATKLVERWNAELAAKRSPQFSPTIGAAMRAGKPWLRLHCPGCRQVYEIDLRRIVRPHDFPITGLRAALVCESMCRRTGPKPELLGLAALPQAPEWLRRSGQRMSAVDNNAPERPIVLPKLLMV